MAKQKVILLGAEPASLVNFRLDLIKQLLLLGYDVHLAAAKASPDLLAIFADVGATFHPINFARAGMNPIRDTSTTIELYKLFRREKPDALIAYTSKPNIYGSFAAKLAGVNNVTAMITGLGYTFIDGAELKRRLAKRLIVKLYKTALSFCTHVIFQNPDDRDEFQNLKLIPQNLTPTIVNGSGINTKTFVQKPLPTEIVFLVIARLLVDKGIREYAAAARTVWKKFPNAKFQILGALDPSPNAIGAAEVEAWKEYGVEYLGVTTDVRPFIAAASVVVLPSYREGTPRSILEGMAMGRAIVTTDVPGCRETVVDGLNGYLVPARNAEALADAMCRLAGDAKLRQRMGNEARKIAVSKYDAVAVALDTIRKAGL